MKNIGKIAIAVFALALSLSARAEFIAGVSAGNTKVSIDYVGTGTSDSVSSGTGGFFGQYRFDNGLWGIHVGISGHDTKHNAVRSDGVLATVETFATYDLLAMLTLGERYAGNTNYFVAGGFSILYGRAWLNETPHLVSHDSATGLKIGGGVEHSFANRWTLQASLESAFHGRPDKAPTLNTDFSSTAFRLNIGYRF